MGTLQTNDRNGNSINVDTNPVGPNVACSQVLADPSTGAKVSVAPNGNSLLVSSDGTTATYRAAGVAQALFSTSASVLLEVVGSASKTVRIKRVALWAQAATKTYAEMTLVRCTGVSAGSPAAVTAGKHDVADVVATAVVNVYAAAAAAGAGHVVTGGGVLSTGSAAPPVQLVWDFCRNQDKALILRGVGDVLEVFNNTAALGAGTFGFDVEWEEMS
jgi:hypothetical protein